MCARVGSLYTAGRWGIALGNVHTINKAIRELNTIIIYVNVVCAYVIS